MGEKQTCRKCRVEVNPEYGVMRCTLCQGVYCVEFCIPGGRGTECADCADCASVDDYA